MKSFFSVFSIAVALCLSQETRADGIPCLEGTTVKNADEANVCKAILPQCSALKDTIVKNLKDMLEWKIYGYRYLQKDIKLDSLSGMRAGSVPDGDPLPYPVCSIVGNKISNSERGEVEKQSFPGGRSCGEYPNFQNGSSTNYKTTIIYDGDHGKRWSSYVMGAYPWELRRNAYDVITELKSDLSNLDDVIKANSMVGDIKGTLLKIKEITSKLSADVKATCNQPQEKPIIESCKSKTLSISDPVQKLCTLAKAQLALNEMAVPNMLIYEVMDRTKVMHKKLFSEVFDSATHPKFHALLEYCKDNRSFVEIAGSFLNPVETILGHMIAANKSYSCFASCLTGGEKWYTNTTNGDAVSTMNSSDSQENRKCIKQTSFDLRIGAPVEYNPSRSFNQSMNFGFAGMIEVIIRNDVCGQKGLKTAPSICDTVGIKDKPAGI